MTKKIDTAHVFERIFTTYRDQATLFIPAAIVVYLPVAVLTILFAGSVAGLLAVAVVGVLAGVYLQGMSVEAVRDIADGRRDHTVGSLLRSVLPVVGPLLLVGLLAGLGVALGFVLLIVPGLFLLTIWALVAPVTVIERPGVGAAFGRSRELVRGNGWAVFGVIVVLFLVQLALNQLLALLFGGADSEIGSALATLIASVVIGPLSAIAAAVMYLELRAAKGEGDVDGGVASREPSSLESSPLEPSPLEPSPQPEASPAPTSTGPASGVPTDEGDRDAFGNPRT